MSAAPPQPHLFRRFAETIAIASVGAAAPRLSGLPAGWLPGPIIRVSAPALAPRQVLRALPIAFAPGGAAGRPRPRGGGGPMLQSVVALAGLVAASAGAGWLACRFRMPGGRIAGALAASGVVHGAGWVHAFLPVPVAICS